MAFLAVSSSCCGPGFPPSQKPFRHFGLRSRVFVQRSVLPRFGRGNLCLCISFKRGCVQVISDARSEGHEERERSIREEDRGEVVGVFEVSKTEQLREKEEHCPSVCILFLNVLLLLTCAYMHRVCVCAAQCDTEVWLDSIGKLCMIIGLVCD